MNEGLEMPQIQLSRRLPAAEAWREPEKWLDEKTGLPKVGIKKFQLPTDDRGFVMPDRAILEVKKLFHPEFKWPFKAGDGELKPDDHHFHYEAEKYRPENNGGSPIPNRFRELPTMIGTIPRQFHNVIHDFTLEPEMPPIEEMQRYIENYLVSQRIFKQLYLTARNTMLASGEFDLRRNDVFLHPERIGGRDFDEIGEAYLSTQFRRHFGDYRRALEKYLIALDEQKIIIPLAVDLLEKPQVQPRHVVRLLGRIVNRKTINFTPLVIGEAA